MSTDKMKWRKSYAISKSPFASCPFKDLRSAAWREQSKNSAKLYACLLKRTSLCDYFFFGFFFSFLWVSPLAICDQLINKSSTLLIIEFYHVSH
jgi:hypothetical protein